MTTYFNTEIRTTIAEAMQENACGTDFLQDQDSYSRMAELLQDKRETLVSCRDYAKKCAQYALEQAQDLAARENAFQIIQQPMTTHALWMTFLLMLQKYVSKEQCEWCKSTNNVWSCSVLNEKMLLCQPCREASTCKKLID